MGRDREEDKNELSDQRGRRGPSDMQTLVDRFGKTDSYGQGHPSILGPLNQDSL